MKSKILALSKNEEFKSLLKKKKISNKYVNILVDNIGVKPNFIIATSASSKL